MALPVTIKQLHRPYLEHVTKRYGYKWSTIGISMLGRYIIGKCRYQYLKVLVHTSTVKWSTMVLNSWRYRFTKHVCTVQRIWPNFVVLDPTRLVCSTKSQLPRFPVWPPCNSRPRLNCAQNVPFRPVVGPKVMLWTVGAWCPQNALANYRYCTGLRFTWQSGNVFVLHGNWLYNWHWHNLLARTRNGHKQACSMMPTGSP